MKKLFILFILIVATNAYSQDAAVPVAKKVVNKFIKFGTKAGLNFNTSDLDKIMADNPSLDDAKENINGFYVGIYSEIKLLMLYLRPELHYSQFTDNVSVKQSRLEAPISLGLKVLPILSGFAGPTLRYKISSDDIPSVEEVKQNATVGIHIGARLHLGKLGIDVRYDKGLSDEEVGLIGANNIPSGVKIDNSAGLVSLGLSYAF
ncbi:MAG: hypothetical protein ACI9TK_000955 [Flavobacteriaceae bacterium]|jgi:hypothetical protein|tara:strand:- start:5449 stop:6063 length:615 start_codon:yes stop_codon:yes gene_type:complete